ncbi:MAG: hypothetical protein Hyperionvirus3_106 [Hyperionvirus sp.]|uniref:Uncharacterized protein n=1 Tax=Hyperionvirus sp. TaxID=2487770 RepID=A0A3G5A6S5_9VIRU|nr:MAG: hypothetical protein Hyperionvirus3_106 [Hyperionvirus sp.]
MSKNYAFISFDGEKLFDSQDYQIGTCVKIINCQNKEEAVEKLLEDNELFSAWVGGGGRDLYDKLFGEYPETSAEDDEYVVSDKLFEEIKIEYSSNLSAFISAVNSTKDKKGSYMNEYAIIDTDEVLYKILMSKSVLEEEHAKIKNCNLGG